MATALYLVRVGPDRYVKAFARTSGAEVPQYTTTQTTDLRSEACSMSWNIARSVASRINGSIVAA